MQLLSYIMTKCCCWIFLLLGAKFDIVSQIIEAKLFCCLQLFGIFLGKGKVTGCSCSLLYDCSHESYSTSKPMQDVNFNIHWQSLEKAKAPDFTHWWYVGISEDCQVEDVLTQAECCPHLMSVLNLIAKSCGIWSIFLCFFLKNIIAWSDARSSSK